LKPIINGIRGRVLCCVPDNSKLRTLSISLLQWRQNVTLTHKVCVKYAVWQTYQDRFSLVYVYKIIFTSTVCKLHHVICMLLLRWRNKSLW